MRLAPDLVRGLSPLLVLRALADGDASGRELLARIHELGGGLEVADGTIYPVLYRLEGRGEISASWRRSAGARSQRVYRLTSTGRTALAAERRRWSAALTVLAPFLAGAPT